MKRYQIDLLTTIESLLVFLDDNVDVFKDNPKVMEAIARLKAIALETNEQKPKQAVNTKSVTAVKVWDKEQMIKTTTIVRKGLAAIAAATDDVALKTLCDFPISQLDDMRESDMVEICRKMYLAAVSLAAELKKWDVTQEEIDSLGENCDSFLNKNSTIRNVKVSSEQATDSIGSLLDQAMDLLKNKLDVMMATFEKPKPDFYIGYKHVRQIVHHAATHGNNPDKPTETK